jgi:hypothetical protein
MISTAQNFRHRAMAAEQAAREATSRASRKEWEQIAIEWHALASRCDQSEQSGDTLELELE